MKGVSGASSVIKLCFAIWVLWTVSTDARAELSNSSSCTLFGAIDFLVEDNDQSFEQILKAIPSDWQKLQKQAVSFGFYHKPIWLRATMEKGIMGSENCWFSVENPLIDFVDFYVATTADPLTINDFTHFISGDRVPFEQRPFNSTNFVFPVAALNKGDTYFYVRLETEGSLSASMRLQTPEEYSRRESISQFFQVAFLVVFLGLILHTIFMYISLRDNKYLIYLVLTACFFIFFQTYSGIGFQYFWPGSMYFQNCVLLVSQNIGTAVFCYFILKLYNLKNNVRLLYKTLVLTMNLCIVNTILSFVIPYNISVIQSLILTLIACIASVVTSTIFLKRRSHVRNYLFVASLPASLGLILLAFNKFGFLGPSLLSDYGLQFSLVWMILYLSVVLSLSLNHERRKRAGAEQQAIENLEKYKAVFSNAMEGLFRSTLEGDLIDANPAMASIFGYESVHTLIESITNAGKQLYADEKDRVILRQRLMIERRIVGYEVRGKRRNGKVFWGAVNLQLVSSTKSSSIHIEGSIVDITGKKLTEEQLQYSLKRDFLTDLFNRQEFDLQLGHYLASRQKGVVLGSFLHISIDRFKLVNSLYGYSVGDRLLVRISEKLRHFAYKSNCLARLSGDEFGLLLYRQGEIEALQSARLIKNVIRELKYEHSEKLFHLSASIGLVVLDENIRSSAQALGMADVACRLAREKGPNNIYIADHKKDLLQQNRVDMEWVDKINVGLTKGNFELYAQKIEPTQESHTDGLHCEVLVRYRDKQGRLFSPNEFIPIAVKFDLMQALEEWVIEKCFRTLRENSDSWSMLTQCNINLSAVILASNSFKQFLIECFEKYAIPYKKICFEITESFAISNIPLTQDFLRTFREKGCQFALDDFGSGFASYDHLRNLAIDYLKIDGNFIRNMIHDEANHNMVDSMNQIGKVLNKKTVAEYVENEEVYNAVKALGIDYVQGYFIGEPIAFSEQLSSMRSQSKSLPVRS